MFSIEAIKIICHTQLIESQNSELKNVDIYIYVYIYMYIYIHIKYTLGMESLHSFPFF